MLLDATKFTVIGCSSRKKQVQHVVQDLGLAHIPALHSSPSCVYPCLASQRSSVDLGLSAFDPPLTSHAASPLLPVLVLLGLILLLVSGLVQDPQ